MERKKKEAEEKESAALRRQYERERQARLEEVSSDSMATITITLQFRDIKKLEVSTGKL